MTDKVARIPNEMRAGATYAHVRLDLPRDASMFVTRNVAAKHVHITLGKNDATLIIHPHAAKRLIANIAAVLDGKEFTSE